MRVSRNGRSLGLAAIVKDIDFSRYCRTLAPLLWGGMQPRFKTSAVLDLLLNRDNPRHVSKSNQAQVIAYLVADEETYNLARHMSQHGINPLEVVAVFPDEDGNLVVAEGNRRVCAAQLLTDPEKAPESATAKFRALAAKSQDVSQINVAVFDDYGTAQPWLQVRPANRCRVPCRDKGNA